MSMKWEMELRELRSPSENDESDDVFRLGDTEDDVFNFCECASDTCLGDWLGAVAGTAQEAI